MGGTFSKRNLNPYRIADDKLGAFEGEPKNVTFFIKMKGNNYDYYSAVKAIEQVTSYVHLNKKVSGGDPTGKSYKWYNLAQHPTESIPGKHDSNFVNIINEQWDSGVFLKKVLDTGTTSYECVKYETLYKQHNEKEENIEIKTSILRLFFHLSLNKTNKVEFAPILVKEINKHTQPKYGGATNTEHPKIVSDDLRRTILSVVVTQLTSTGFNDKHYILKMSSNEKNIQGYKDEAKIYEKLKPYAVYTGNNVVKYCGSGEYNHLIGRSLSLGTDSGITFSNEQWQGIWQGTEFLNHDGFYILLENTLGYYDYEDFVKLGYDISTSRCCHSTYISTSFVNIYKTLKKAKTNAFFFHGDFHNNNVKINKELNVKLFDFDYSGILGVNGYISNNIQYYKLKYDENLIFLTDNTINTSPNIVTINTSHNIVELQNFLFWFDIFRMWLSTCKTLNTLVTIHPTHTELHKMVTVFNNWFTKNYDHQWHEYFMNDYFYHIYKEKTVTNNGSTPSSHQQNEESFVLSLNSDVEKTLVIGEKTLSNALVNGQGGGSKSANTKTNYKKYGKFDVVLHNETYKMRVVWKYNCQFFIKRQNGTYEKISKKNIKM